MDLASRVERSRLVVLFVVSLFDLVSCYVTILYLTNTSPVDVLCVWLTKAFFTVCCCS